MRAPSRWVERGLGVTVVTLPGGRPWGPGGELGWGLDVPEGGHLLLDFIQVGHVTAAWLGSLITLRRRVARAGGRLTLINLNPLVRAAFTVTGLDTLLDIREGQPSGRRWERSREMETRSVTVEVRGICHRADLRKFDQEEAARIESLVAQGVERDLAQEVLRGLRGPRAGGLTITAGEVVTILARSFWRPKPDDPQLLVESESGVIGRVPFSATRPMP